MLRSSMMLVSFLTESSFSSIMRSLYSWSDFCCSAFSSFSVSVDRAYEKQNAQSDHVMKIRFKTYFFELADFLRKFALILHILDTCFVQDIEFLLEELSLLWSDFSILLQRVQDVVSLGSFDASFFV